MNRDLVFFLTGLVFGVAVGYFVFAMLADNEATETTPIAPPPTVSGGLDLASEPSPSAVDQGELARLSERADAEPRNAAVRVELGQALLEAGDLETAVGWLESALSLDDSNLQARNLLANGYLNLGRTFEAVGAYEEVLSVDPNNPSALLGLGRMKLYMLKDMEGGLELWERLVTERGDSEQAREVRDELEALRSAHSAPVSN